MTPGPAVLWICAFVVAAVFAIMIHSIATFRRARTEPGAGLGASPGALAEVLWAIVPIFIMVSTALPAVKMLASEHATQSIQVAVQAHNDP